MTQPKRTLWLANSCLLNENICYVYNNYPESVLQIKGRTQGGGVYPSHHKYLMFSLVCELKQCFTSLRGGWGAKSHPLFLNLKCYLIFFWLRGTKFIFHKFESFLLSKILCMRLYYSFLLIWIRIQIKMRLCKGL